MDYFVYLICAEFEGRKLYKIGYTRRNIEKRIKEIKTGNGSDIYLVNFFKSKWGTKIESQLHKFYLNKKINREWFDLSDDDLKKFGKRCNLIHETMEIITNENSYYLDTGKLF